MTVSVSSAKDENRVERARDPLPGPDEEQEGLEDRRLLWTRDQAREHYLGGILCLEPLCRFPFLPKFNFCAS